MNDWLQELKPGDQVVTGDGLYSERISVVERITATQILACGAKYNRKTGRRVGASDWNRSWLNKATPEAVESVQRKAYISTLCHLDATRLRSLDTETLRAAVETLHTNAKPVE